MFSQEPRRFLKKNQLMEVICQFRFPEILAIAAKPPVDFQEAIRDEFPQYSARKEIPAPKIAGTPGNFSLQNQPETINYQFAAADGSWRVNLTSKFISPGQLPVHLLGGLCQEAGPASGGLHSDL